MKRLLRLVGAVLAGVLLGGLVNMALIMVSGKVIPPPMGADVTTTEGLKASIHLFGPRHYLFPFLAHSVGTFAGALVATLLARDRGVLPAYAVGFVFLAGGTMSALMLPAAGWFITLDLILAYLPAAWLAHRLATRGARPADAG